MMRSHSMFSRAGSTTSSARCATVVLKGVIAFALGVAVLASASLAATAQSNDQANVLLREAMHVEISDGDLERAIELYRTIVERHGNARPVAAEALLRMAMSYEKLGMREARATYEELLSDYADQADAVAEARSRLASFPSDDEAGRPVGVIARQLLPEVEGFNGGPTGGDVGSISPDGRYVGFATWGGLPRGNRDLAVYDVQEDRARLLTNWGDDNEYVTSMAWSRDGARIAYSRWNDASYSHEELRVLRFDESDGCWLSADEFRDDPMACLPSSAADDHILLADDQRPNVRPMAWSRDGDFIVCAFNFWDGARRIGTISSEDGTVRILRTLGEHHTGLLSLSPDDRYIVYAYPQGDDLSARRRDEQVLDVFILATDGSSEKRLVSHPANDLYPFWTPDGERVVFSSDRSGERGLYAVEVRDGRPAGRAELVRPDVGDLTTLGFSRSGALYYKRRVSGVSNVYVAELDLSGEGTLSGRSLLTDRGEGTNRLPSWSPDGRQIAYFSRRGQGQFYAVVKSMDTGEERDFALPFSAPEARSSASPGWSADGRNLLIFRPGGSGTGELGPLSYRLDLNTGELAPEAFVRDLAFKERPRNYHGVATPRQEAALRANKIRIVLGDPSGHELFTDSGELQRADEEVIWVEEVVGRPPRDGEGESVDGGVRKMLPGGEVEELGPRAAVNSWALSPDGTRLAWASLNRVLIMPVKGGAIRELTQPYPLNKEGGRGVPSIHDLLWTPDGQTILYRVQFLPPDGRLLWKVPADGGAPQSLAIELERAEWRSLHRFQFHPDGKRVAFSTLGPRVELWLMEGFPWQVAGR